MILTSEQLSAVFGIILSLAFAYIPKLKDWFNSKDSQTKALVMLAALAVVSVVEFGFGCGKLFTSYISVTCDQAGAEAVVINFIAAAIANQSTFLVAVKPFQPAKAPTV